MGSLKVSYSFNWCIFNLFAKLSISLSMSTFEGRFFGGKGIGSDVGHGLTEIGGFV